MYDDGETDSNIHSATYRPIPIVPSDVQGYNTPLSGKRVELEGDWPEED